MYPRRYTADELTEHLLARLERRRPAFETWDDYAEAQLREEAVRILEEAGTQFREIADDPDYWKRVEKAVLDVALPRYLRLARAFHQAEQNAFGAWRRGDALSRVIYTLTAIGLALISLRIPPLRFWLGPLSLLAIAGAPFLPDLQAALARRRYRAQLEALVEDMREEQRQLGAYRPLSDHLLSGSDP
ncbi:MAG: hypothetical protein D6729_03490 [Deltaproteobacteria bacterium]|nr:MAG: hypothetical protein D6729_03490 [Deltaproteobacteria bacterium]